MTAVTDITQLNAAIVSAMEGQISVALAERSKRK
jgi:hypothetical protein